MAIETIIRLIVSRKINNQENVPREYDLYIQSVNVKKMEFSLNIEKQLVVLISLALMLILSMVVQKYTASMETFHYFTGCFAMVGFVPLAQLKAVSDEKFLTLSFAYLILLVFKTYYSDLNLASRFTSLILTTIWQIF